MHNYYINNLWIHWI